MGTSPSPPEPNFFPGLELARTWACMYNTSFHFKNINLQYFAILIDRRVARIWKKGKLFWKSEKSANDLDPNFHCSWISFTRFVRKLRRNFSESSEIQTFFQPKNRWSPKKKGLHRNWGLFFGPNRKFKRFFSPKIGGLQKKRSSPKLRRLIFRPKSEI